MNSNNLDKYRWLVQEFVTAAIERGDLRDSIIDEHHLLLWIKHCAERPKKTRRGVDKIGSFIGAVSSSTHIVRVHSH